ncbi:integral membrane protein [Pseudovirgaria hyperparasitica]|uniref:Integral membrane protein n=1 Tax=Pseudovirgaria hyperparasitica TaxID=470096 RepID=A0A6A6VZF3_9PEZI|nr:uncharacterized protein EJ05DRAFT_513437 [Pseudovirgaria hyperparasitica]KAF2755124.1 integral membrane protein [Pseudovirgaria hyperparasitica]
MGKAGRFACIFVPMGLTIASLLCLLLVFLGGLSKSNALGSLYFMQLDASNFTANPDLSAVDFTDIDDQFLDMFKSSFAKGDLKDFYNIYIWNYCDGTADDKSGDKTIDHCSSRQAAYWFNVKEVWGMDGAALADHFPKALDDGLKVYEKVAKFMFACYTVAFWVTVAEIVVGILAIFSRWGSLCTTIVSTAAGIFVTAAAITSTALFATFTGIVNTSLKPYHIHASMSTKMLAIVWLAVAFNVGAGFFWLISTCCCSGKSDPKHKKTTFAQRTPYTYEPLHDHHHAGGAVPLGQMGPGGAYKGGNNAYEPFRSHA